MYRSLFQKEIKVAKMFEVALRTDNAYKLQLILWFVSV